MSFKIGFAVENENKNAAVGTENNANETQAINTITPRKSVVKVYFAARNASYSYYNDKFDLHIDDMVYVDGKLEGLIGRVTEVEYNFKIKISDYKKVVALIDTSVKGEFYLAGSHIIAFDKGVIPFEKVSSWFIAPKDDEEFEVSTDNTSFSLDDLSGMNINTNVANRGYDYYAGNRVIFIEIRNGKGKAIVEGNKNYYIVEFEYENRNIKNLICNCYCVGACKHEFAVMLQLKDTLKVAQEEYNKSDDYVAIMKRQTFFNIAVNSKMYGKILFE